MSEIILTDDHKYFVDGMPVPGVTSILKEMLDLDFGMIDEFYRDRGVQIHKACELILKGERTIVFDDRIAPYIKGFHKFLKETEFKAELIEKKVYHPLYKYCGQLDILGVMKLDYGLKSLVDIKGGGKAKYYRLQTALYHEALGYERRGQYQRMCLHLDGKGGYSLDPHDELGDFSAALSLVNAYHARRQYK